MQSHHVVSAGWSLEILPGRDFGELTALDSELLEQCEVFADEPRR